MLFPLLPIPAPVFTSHVRSHQNLLTTFFSCLGFLVLLSERALPFLGVSESPARRASGRGSQGFQGFLGCSWRGDRPHDIGSWSTQKATIVLLPRVTNETSWFKPVSTVLGIALAWAAEEV